MSYDFEIAQPANPEAPDTEIVWYDSDPTGTVFRNGDIGGAVVADLAFDQDVTLNVYSAAGAGGALVLVKTQTITGGTPAEVRIGFKGFRTQVTLKTGGTPPSTWHVAGRLTSHWDWSP